MLWGSFWKMDMLSGIYNQIMLYKCRTNGLTAGAAFLSALSDGYDCAGRDMNAVIIV